MVKLIPIALKPILAAALFALWSSQLSGQTSLSLFTGVNSSSGTPRNDYTGFVGTEFTTGNGPIEITWLGRAYLSSNTHAHTIKIVNAATGIDVPGASVQLTMSANGAAPYQFAALATPVTLAANSTYFLVSQEQTGGDTWNDLQDVSNTVLATSYLPASPLKAAIYSDASGAYQVVPGTPGFSYVPPNFLYTPVTSSQTTVTLTPPVGTSSSSLLPPYVYNGTAMVAGLNAQTYGSVLQFLLDGQNFYFAQPYSGATSYTVPVDPSTLLSGNHTLSAIYTSAGSPTIKSNAGVFGVGEPASTQPLVITYQPGPIRNNFSGWIGYEFTTGADTLRVTGLGRVISAGDTAIHIVKLVDAATGIDVPGSSIAVNTSTAPAGSISYSYYVPTNGILLQPKRSYYLLTQETAGGDTWYDIGAINTAGMAINGPVYQPAGGSYSLVPLPGNGYGPVSMAYSDTAYPVAPYVNVTSPTGSAVLSGIVKVTTSVVTYQGVNPSPTVSSYQLVVNGQPYGALSSSSTILLDTTAFANGAYQLQVIATDSAGGVGKSGAVSITIKNSGTGTGASPFVTSVAPTFLRNNYSGYVGMQFITFTAPLQISSLGRYCIAGNSGAHTIKIVQSNGVDLPGATTSVNMAGCVANQFVYAPLSAAVTLAASSTFYLVDQETTGGDQWYDFSVVYVSNDADVYAPAYANTAGTLVIGNIASESFGPLNFLYTVGSGATGALATSIYSVSLDSFGGSSPVTATASDSPGVTISSVQIQVDGYSITPRITSFPYTQSFPSINLGQHSFSSVAQDSLGNIANSAPFPYSFALQHGYDIELSKLMSTPGAMRNDYSGWVGFQLTTGSTGLRLFGTINGGTAEITPYIFLGRPCVAGNAQPHIVKFVLASTGADVPGGSTWVNCGTVGTPGPGQLSFGPLSATLQPNTTYYLVSQEVSGGDQWPDIGSAIPDSTFAVDGPIYFDGYRYVLVQLPNHSYAGITMFEATSPI